MVILKKKLFLKANEYLNMTILREKKNFDIQSYGVKFSYFSFRGFNKGFIYLKEKEIPSAEIQKFWRKHKRFSTFQ